jgi:CheY-like chemotaxis protein
MLGHTLAADEASGEMATIVKEHPVPRLARIRGLLVARARERGRNQQDGRTLCIPSLIEGEAHACLDLHEYELDIASSSSLDTGLPGEQMIGKNDHEPFSPEAVGRLHVRLALPNTGEPPGERSRSAGAPRDTSKPGRRAVLLVDDEPVVRRTVALMLESFGFEVVVAEDGRVAVERYAERHADLDLVLLDMIMPNMGGDDAYRAMRDIDASVPVVVCSGYAADETVRSMQAQGLAGFLAKPYRRAELAAIIEQTLGG